MSWTERRALEEKEAVRANQKREDAFKHGHPVAPYNTTQYLMEDHIKNEEIAPDLHLEGHYHRNNSRGISVFLFLIPLGNLFQIVYHFHFLFIP
jgi:hypothetical protein